MVNFIVMVIAFKVLVLILLQNSENEIIYMFIFSELTDAEVTSTETSGLNIVKDTSSKYFLILYGGSSDGIGVCLWWW